MLWIEVAHGASQISHHIDIGMAGHAEVGLDLDAAGAIEFAAGAALQCPSQRGGGHPGGPDHGAGGQEVRLGQRGLALLILLRQLVADAKGIDVGHLGPSEHLRAQHLQLLARALGEVRCEAAQDAWRTFQQDDAGHARVDAAELTAQGVLGDFSQGARHLHTRGASADNGKGQPGFPTTGVGLPLGLLKSAQDAASDGEGIAQGFETRRVLGPVVATEIAVRGARGDNQAVIVQVLAAIQDHAARGRVDGGDLAHEHGQATVFDLLAQDVADGGGDGRCRQASRGHLVQQRLKQVVVGAVDHDHVDMGAGQCLGRFQTTKAAADDDHPGLLAVDGGPGGRVGR